MYNKYRPLGLKWAGVTYLDLYGYPVSGNINKMELDQLINKIERDIITNHGIRAARILEIIIVYKNDCWSMVKNNNGIFEFTAYVAPVRPVPKFHLSMVFG